MGFFDHLQRKGVSAIHPEAATIRTIGVKSNTTTTTTTKRENGRGSEKPRPKPARASSVGSIGQADRAANRDTQPRRQALGHDAGVSSNRNGRDSLKRSSTMESSVARQRPPKNPNAPRLFVDHVRSPSGTSAKRIKKKIDTSDYREGNPAPANGDDQALFSPGGSVTDYQPTKLQSPYPSRSHSRQLSTASPASALSVASTSKLATAQSNPPAPSSRKRHATPSTSRWWNSSDDSDSDSGFSDDDFDFRKRVPIAASVEPDLKRRVRNTDAFVMGGEPVRGLELVHGIDITRPMESRGAFGHGSCREIVGLQYPSSYQRERYVNAELSSNFLLRISFTLVIQVRAHGSSRQRRS